MRKIIILLCSLTRVKCDEGTTQYEDNCEYTYPALSVRCGDQCTSKYDACQCGSTKFEWTLPLHDQYCCTPSSEHCTRDTFNRGNQVFGDGICANGTVLNVSTPCEVSPTQRRCFNSYQHSRYVGPNHHYTCPHLCVPWRDMCTGVDWCGEDVEVCGEQLRCPPSDYVRRHTIDHE